MHFHTNAAGVITSQGRAQPNPPKIHEGWWAYKEVVQGSFVPAGVLLIKPAGGCVDECAYASPGLYKDPMCAYGQNNLAKLKRRTLTLRSKLVARAPLQSFPGGFPMFF
ncbi:hypothetical protein FQN60_002623 [Etheostoma spectabile]|uniref:Uncharacterized protein n=1 Tax=Etheostoma spectabile TaxID=54343 RepID=A0A5J5CGN4_9PERO|nr:hypothetical protein FQN60_002623 [Etheostoma spectabile]